MLLDTNILLQKIKHYHLFTLFVMLLPIVLLGIEYFSKLSATSFLDECLWKFRLTMPNNHALRKSSQNVPKDLVF